MPDNFFHPAHNPKMPSGLLKRMNIRRFTPDLFNNSNSHNPVVARTCPRCNGDGFYRVFIHPTEAGQPANTDPEPTFYTDDDDTAEPDRKDVTCELCHALGSLEQPEPFFKRPGWWTRKAAPNDAGFIKCPRCGIRFPIHTNQYWTGLRHTCGQKIRLVGPNAAKCWTRHA